MQLYNAIAQMVKEANTTENKVSLSVFGNKYIAVSKARGNVMSADNLNKIADYCGYELVLMPKDLVPRCAIPVCDPQEDSD